LDLVVKLHGVGKTFLYLNVSVFMVGLGLLLLESDSCKVIRVLFARQILKSRGRPTAGAFVFGVRWFPFYFVGMSRQWRFGEMYVLNLLVMGAVQISICILFFFV